MIKDAKVIKMMNKVDIPELTESLMGYPEEEREGKTDMDLLLSEAEYFLDMFEEDGTLLSGDLQESRHILNKTKYGKVIPANARTLKPIYQQWDIDRAKETVNSYMRLKRLVKKLYAE